MTLPRAARPPVRRRCVRAAAAFVAVLVGMAAAPVGAGSTSADVRSPAARLAAPAPAAAESAAAPGAPTGATASGITEVLGPTAAPGRSSALPAAPSTDPAGEPPTAGQQAAPAAPDEPTQMYLDAQAHAGDRVTFEPGGRVTVGFSPHPGDTAPVGGTAPRALAAGTESGTQLTAGPGGPGGAPGAGSAGSGGPGWPADPTQSTLPVDAPSGAVGTAATAASAVVPPVSAAAEDAAAGLRREVYGFLPYWELKSARLHDDVLSYIAYFGVGVDGSGNLETHNANGSLTTGWAGWTSSSMTGVINTAHRQHTRVTLTIQEFAWTPGQAQQQAALLGSPSARARLARQAVAAVRARGADGLNLDFEPIVPGYQDEFVALLKSIRAEFTRYGGGYHLSFDSTGSPAGYPLEAALARGVADIVFVMGYDYRTAGASSAGSIDPLSGPAYDLTDTINAFKARVPASKIVLGVPYYGRAWSTVSSAVNARTQSAAKYGGSVSVVYTDALAVAAQHGRRYDAREVSAWVAYKKQNCTARYGCVTTWRQLYYDDAATLRARYDVVNLLGIKGVGIWALGYDGTRTELWQALIDKFQRDTTPPRTGIRLLPATEHDEGFAVSWSGVDDWSGVASYDVQVSVDGGAWSNWLSATKATSGVWLGTNGHRAAFRVRARDGKGHLSAWNVASVATARPALARGGFATVTSSTLNVRASASSSANQVGTLAAGDVVAITGGPVASGGYTWWQVTGPITTWGPVGLPMSYVWVAGSGNGSTFLAARTAPNATAIAAGIHDVGFGGAGASSLGTSAAAIAARSFSPNGDGAEDALAITWTNAVAFSSMSLSVLRPDGTVLSTIALGARGSGVQRATWDGRAKGARVRDGTYLLQLTGSAAGVTDRWPSATPATAAQVARFAVIVDTVPPAMTAATLGPAAFSPNGDGIADRVRVTGKAAGAAIAWRLDVTRGGTTIRTLVGAGSTASTAWDGRDGSGTVPPDGPCTVTLRFFDAAGNTAARSWTVVLDRTKPVVTLGTQPGTFSPNGDGAAETASIAWTSSEPATGTLSISGSSGRVALRRAVAGAAGGISWSGRDGAGRAVADGRYTATLAVRDAAGNATTRRIAVIVDRTARGLRWSTGQFYPQDGDRLAATARISWTLVRSARATLRIVDRSGAVIRTVFVRASEGPGLHGFTWNGTTGTGAWAAPGTYTAVLTVVSPLGTSTLTRSILADAFVLAPSSATVAGGKRLSVRIVSSEPVRGTPTASLRLAGRSPVAMTVVRNTDGTWTASAIVSKGAPGPATVTVTAVDAGGHQNASTLGITIL